MKTNLIRISAIAAMFFALSACSGGNSSDTPLVDSSGKHPANWRTAHKTVAAVSTVTCAGCHGNDMTGGISKISCMNPAMGCHTSNPALATQATGCVSCHAAGATGPNGDTAPNRANAHAKHMALNGVTCASCHNGAGYGTPLHANGTANIIFASTLNAKTGTLGYDTNTSSCAAVICHGGQATPSWKTGSITVATDCLKCHEQGSVPVAPDTTPTPQYNSFHSGKGTIVGNLHQFHLQLNFTAPPNFPIICSSCHNIDKMDTVHFNTLSTPGFTAPANTIGDATGVRTKVTNYTVGNCTTVCHNTRKWEN